MNDCYIGIDAGTTNIKSAAFDIDGNRIALFSSKTPVVKVLLGHSYEYEFNPERIIKTVINQLRQIHQSAPGYRIRGIAVSSMGEPGIPLDSAFRPLTNSIAWYDTRSRQEAADLSDFLGNENIYKITGHFSSYKFGITKIMWFRKHAPELFSRTKYWMSLNEYILFRLCGEHLCDYSIAARTLCFDVQKKDWSEKILNAAKIPAEIFSKTVPGGTPLGLIRKEIAEAAKLPEDIIISTGGHDHACAAIGTNIIRPGHVLCSMGTSEVSMMVVPELLNNEDAYRDQCVFYPHCSSGLYRSLSSMQSCGVSLDWAAAFTGCKGTAKYEKLAKLAENSRNACPVFYPFQRGTMFHPESGGIWVGLKDYHTKNDLAASVFLGLGSETKYLTEKIALAAHQPILYIHAAGGPSKSEYFMQLKSNLMKCEVILHTENEAACLGAACLAAIGAGDLSFDSLDRMAAKPSKVFSPVDRPDADEFYAFYAAHRDAALSIAE